MISSRRDAGRRILMAGLALSLLFATFGGGLRRASAQSVPGVPPGVDTSAYQAQFDAINAAYATCMQNAGSDKAAIKACNDTAKADLKALIEQIKADIKAAKDDHKHDTTETGPVTNPEVPSEPQQEVPAAPPSGSSSTQAIAGPRIDQRVLVLAADGSEPALGSIRQTLEFMGTPYDVVTTSSTDVTPAMLSDGDRALYSAVILTNGQLAYSNSKFASGYGSDFSADEWTTLKNFEAKFQIRQVTWYTWPEPEYGLNWPAETRDTQIAPVEGKLTSEGRQVFSYLTLAPIVIRDAIVYLAKPVNATVRPLITTSDGYALASIYKYPDGRENLAVTFDTNEFLTHSFQVSYGLVNWATRGTYVGQRRVFMDPQVDDFFYPNDLWNPSDPTTMVSTYRMSATDLQKTADWQAKQQGVAATKDLKLSLVYNGEGTSGVEEYQPDTLTPKINSLQSRFKWINHTWTHLNLNTATYEEAYAELKQNLDLASTLKLTNFNPANLVTPEISGLFNPAAMQAAYDLGIRYVVSDSSRTSEFPLGRANTGMPNASQPSILMIPRRPNNMFYNVSTPEEWASEYNHLYGANGIAPGFKWGYDLTYTQILDKESDVLLRYVLSGEIYPWMFHQSNLRFYDGNRSLLTDLLDATLSKYRTIFRLPILSPRQDQIASKIQERMAFNAADVDVTYNKAASSMTVTSNQTVVVPLTGVKYGPAQSTYNGQVTSFVTVPAGQTVTIPL